MNRAQIIAVLVSIAFASILTANASAMYNPTLGRFMQRDPLGYVDGMSEYQYEQASPSTSLDPSGCVFLLPSPGWGPGGRGDPLEPPEVAKHVHTPGDGPYHPPDDAPVACKGTDSCPTIFAKLATLDLMITSHLNWRIDHPNDPPSKHLIEIANLQGAHFKCQKLAGQNNCYKNNDCRRPFRIPVPQAPPTPVILGIGTGTIIIIIIILLPVGA